MVGARRKHLSVAQVQWGQGGRKEEARRKHLSVAGPGTEVQTRSSLQVLRQISPQPSVWCATAPSQKQENTHGNRQKRVGRCKVWKKKYGKKIGKEA